MRKLFLFMMVSVDGYFEGPNHDISWHNVDAEFNDFAHSQLREIGFLLFGRRTYELMAGWWPTPQGRKDDPTTARLMNEMPKAVVSRGTVNADWENTTVISLNVSGEIKNLKASVGNDIAMFGSNNLCVSLMEAGLVDEFRIMVNPVALGRGTPLFTGLSERMKLRLVRIREFKSGNILHYYHPVR